MMSHRRVGFLIKRQERVSKHRNTTHSRGEMSAYGFLKAETTGASIFAPPGDIQFCTIHTGRYSHNENKARLRLEYAWRCQKGEVCVSGECSFQQQRVRETIPTAGLRRESRKTGTAETSPRKQRRARPQKLNSGIAICG